MLDHYLPVRPLRTLSFLFLLVVVSALWPSQVDRGPDLLRSQSARADSEQHAEQDRQAPPPDLNGILRGTLASLEELIEATAKAAVDAERREEEVQRLKQENERLAAELRRGTEAERLKTEVAEVREQLSHAIAAVSEAQHDRLTSLNEADMLQGEAERARQDLIATKAEIERLMIANSELEQRLIAAEAAPAIQKIGKLNADVFGVGRSEEAFPPQDPELMPSSIEPKEPDPAALSSARTQPPPLERADAIGAGQPTGSAPEPPTAGLDEATLETDARLANFHAFIQGLNEIERKTGGVDLFSDVAAVSARAVNINATLAWDALPPLAKEIYLDLLLDDWGALQDGNGPTVVRILDPSGRVLIEKSSP